jgi:hypothetical protein
LQLHGHCGGTMAWQLRIEFLRSIAELSIVLYIGTSLYFGTSLNWYSREQNRFPILLFNLFSPHAPQTGFPTPYQ